MHQMLEVKRADVDDASEILGIQVAAYAIEAELYDDFDIPPLQQTLEEMKEEFGRQLVLKAILGTEVVGSVRAHVSGETCFIGRLSVRPSCQDRGTGTLLMRAIEESFPEVERFELFTGHKSARNLYLYQKLGYRPFRTEEVHSKLSLIYLEKTRSAEP